MTVIPKTCQWPQETQTLNVNVSSFLPDMVVSPPSTWPSIFGGQVIKSFIVSEHITEEFWMYVKCLRTVTTGQKRIEETADLLHLVPERNHRDMACWIAQRKSDPFAWHVRPHRYRVTTQLIETFSGNWLPNHHTGWTCTWRLRIVGPLEEQFERKHVCRSEVVKSAVSRCAQKVRLG
jgi:hypothetical protein